MPIRPLVLGLAATLVASSAFAAEPSITKYTIEPSPKTNIEAPASLAKTFPHGFVQGLGSGVVFAGKDADGSILLYAVGDRGPNADGPDYLPGGSTKTAPAKIFPAPDYAPTLAKLKVKNGKVEILKLTPLRDAKGNLISGRPLPAGTVGSTGEVPLAADMHSVLPLDAQGLDPEGVAVDPKDGNLWLCDEYGPFLVKVEASTGRILKKYAPDKGLPGILAKRQPNRGFEGVAVSKDGKVFAAVQSILDVDGKVKASKAPFIRILELDPATGATRMFAYPLDTQAYKKTTDAKLGDLSALSSTKLLTVEQGKGADKKMRNIVYAIDLSGATDLSGKTAPDGKPLETLPDVTSLEKLGIKLATKTQVMDLRALGWSAEKAEGLSIAPDHKTLLLTSDNDFGLTIKVDSPATDKDGKPVKDPTDYQMGADGKLSYEGKPVAASLRLEPTTEKTELWVVTLPEALK